MILTRYTGAYVIPDLEKAIMSVSKIDDFNDPFELQIVQGRALTRQSAKAYIRQKGKAEIIKAISAEFPSYTSKQIKKIFQKTRPKMIDSMVASDPEVLEGQRSYSKRYHVQANRIVCMTVPKDGDPVEVPMWGYYGDAHKGIRLHLTEAVLAMGDVLEMNYRNTPTVMDSNHLPGSFEFMQYINDLLTVKSDVWRHEDERRLLIPTGKTMVLVDSAGHPRDYINLPESGVARIDLGIKFPKALIERVLGLRGVFPGLVVFQARNPLDQFFPAYDQIA